MEINATVDKKRTHTHQYTNVNFTLKEDHNIKIEFFTGALGGVFKTEFILLVDGKTTYSKTLYTLFLQRMRHSFEIENIECSIKYVWLSGFWFGHIYVDNKSVS